MTAVRSRIFNENLFSIKMAVSAGLFWVSLVLSVIGAYGDGEFTVLHSPDSLNFIGSSGIKEHTLADVFSASLGLSVGEDTNWDGLHIKNPFNTPEAAVEVYIDGVSSLGDAAHLKGPKYPVEMDEYDSDSFEAMKHRIQQRFSGGKNKLASINLSNLDELSTQKDVFGDIMVPKLDDISLQYLKPTVEEDLKFLMELNILKAVADKIGAGGLSAPDNEIDFFKFYFHSLHAVVDSHGHKSPQVKEATKLLGEALEKLSAAMVKRYDGSVLVAVVTSDAPHIHRLRRSLEAPSRRQGTPGKQSYPEDYAAIFNILLWFGVVFVFTLIAIVYALIDMDPGRDSIIYRMTSTRMKKDN